MLLKTEGGLQPGHRPQKRIGRNRSCVVGCLKHTPLFYRKDFLPGIDFGLVSRFRAWSVLGRRGEKSGFLRLFPNDSRARVWRRPRFEIRADYRRFGGRYWTLISTPTVLLIRSASKSTWDLLPRLVGIDTTSGSSISFFACPTLSLIQSKTVSVTMTRETVCLFLMSSNVLTASSSDFTTQLFLTPPSLK